MLTKFIILYHTYQFIEIFTRDKTIFLKYKIQEQLPCLLVDSWGCLKENYKSYWWLWEEAIQLILNESRRFMLWVLISFSFEVLLTDSSSILFCRTQVLKGFHLHFIYIWGLRRYLFENQFVELLILSILSNAADINITSNSFLHFFTAWFLIVNSSVEMQRMPYRRGVQWPQTRGHGILTRPQIWT